MFWNVIFLIWLPGCWCCTSSISGVCFRRFSLLFHFGFVRFLFVTETCSFFILFRLPVAVICSFVYYHDNETMNIWCRSLNFLFKKTVVFTCFWHKKRKNDSFIDFIDCFNSLLLLFITNWIYYYYLFNCLKFNWLIWFHTLTFRLIDI